MQPASNMFLSSLRFTGIRSVALWCFLSAGVADAGFLSLTWEAPTTYTDGTPLQDLAGYRIYHALSPSSALCPGPLFQFLSSSTSAPAPGMLVSTFLTGLTVGASYNVRVTAVNTRGNESPCSNEVAGNARRDTTPPTVAITLPANNAIVSSTVTVRASASDDIGVGGVQFRYDSTSIGSEIVTPPYEVRWNTTAVLNGSHFLTATVRDSEGNAATSSSVFITVSNSSIPPPPSNPPASNPPGSGSTTAADGDGGGCFIATAAYGSPLAGPVLLLRTFRNRYLMTNPVGEAFVQWYYRHSPPIAARIRQSLPLRLAVLAILWPLVGVAWVSLHPWLVTCVVVIFFVLYQWKRIYAITHGKQFFG